MLWLILSAIIILLFYYNWLYRPWQYWKIKKVITDETQFSKLLDSIFNPKEATEVFEEKYRTSKNNGLKYIGTYKVVKPAMVITDLELIKKIYIKDFNYFHDRTKFIDKSMDPFFGKALISLTGKEWKEMRNTLSPAFTSSKMRAMFSLISECAEQMVENFLNEASCRDGTLNLEMKDLFTRYANDVIATASFGYKCDSFKENDNMFYRMAKEASEFGGIKGLKFLAYIISPTLTKWLNIKIISEEACNFFHSLVTKAVTQREKEGIIRPDMIHLLMQAKKGQLKDDEDIEENIQNAPRKRELNNEDITAQAVLFFVAGFDTSSTLMCYIAYELAVNPDIQARLQDEIDSVSDQVENRIEYDVIMKMVYLDMVISETLRKWPPGVITDRSCVKTYEMEPARPGQPPVIVEPDTTIWIPIYSIHHDADYFPDPEKFDPERFNAENKHNINPIAYAPFGHGPRNCIGSRFALMETKTLFFHLLSKFDIKVIEKTSIPIKLKKGQWNLSVEGGMWLGFCPRKRK